jgi:hypothetical protein
MARKKDRVHILDLIGFGLIDATWPARLPPALGARLQQLLDDPSCLRAVVVKPDHSRRETPMSHARDWPGLGEERIPPGESDAIATIANVSRELLDRSVRPVRRDQHPKHHGCVQARFQVDDDLPETLRHGLFQPGASYHALIRFSNGKNDDDREGDAHGMAVKLLNVAPATGSDGSGSTQDFILVDHPVFFIRNAADYVPFSRAFLAAKQSKLRKWLSFLPDKITGLITIGILYFRFFKDHKHEFDILKQFSSKIPSNPLRIQYWSNTPFRLGPHAIRFTARPILDGAMPPTTASDSPDRLRLAMTAQLEEREASFEFLVQVQTDPGTMPVEDPTIPWDEEVSPYRRIATIRIAPQTFDTPKQMSDCENLSFSPWHTLDEHRPLGGINRVRKLVYDRLSQDRHELNGVSRVEPQQ